MLIKYDMLSVEAMDKIQICLELLSDAGYIERKPTLKETYEDIIGIYNLERNDPIMWQMIWDHKINSLFQMEEQSGVQGIALTKPSSVDDLAVLNSVIRLMAQEKGGEQPVNKYARFKANKRLWYEEMREYGLTNAEMKVLEPIVGGSYGIMESQEKFMQAMQTPELGGFDLNWADRLRKAIAKKSPADYVQLEKEYFDRVAEAGLSQRLCEYTWRVLVGMSRGYGFNASHTLAYSLIGLQEMNLAYRFPIVFWNCACLITDSNGLELEEDEEADDDNKKNKTRDYGKIATAIGKMQATGIDIRPPDINTSNFTFTPDVEHNAILYGINGITGVGEDVVLPIIKNRPYTNFWDCISKNPQLKRSQIITLIKSGVFDNMQDRKELLIEYIWATCDRKKNITLQNMSTLIKRDMLPSETAAQIRARRIYEFNRYLKDNCKQGDIYFLDKRASDFMKEQELYEDYVVTAYSNGILTEVLDAKMWDKKIYQKEMDVFRDWIATNKEKIKDKLNTMIFLDDWNKYGIGTLSSWEMQTICYYYHEHELVNLNKEKYGISDFNDLSETPVVVSLYKNKYPIYQLDMIAGVCLDKNKTKGTVQLLTPDKAVVTVKFPKAYFNIFDKQISEKQEDGTKKIIEKSFFNKGSLIAVQGYRRGNTFIPKKYGNTNTHQLYKIDNVYPNGDIDLRSERKQGMEEEDLDE